MKSDEKICSPKADLALPIKFDDMLNNSLAHKDEKVSSEERNKEFIEKVAKMKMMISN